MPTQLPPSVRYIKNGRKGQWWSAAKSRNQLHAGWNIISGDLLLNPSASYPLIEQKIKEVYGTRTGATQDFNALRDLLEHPSQHLWITFEDGYLWWCTVHDGVTVNPQGEDSAQGHFWLDCDRSWSNQSLQGNLLSMSDLPGTVTSTAGFKGTVCTPKEWPAVLRLLHDAKDPQVEQTAQARAAYEAAVLKLIQRLSPKDFEQLIDHILTRTGWLRISTCGKSREGIDIDAQNLAVNEVAFVQVKSTANQTTLDAYIKKYQQRLDYYARMIFAVHTPQGILTPPADPPHVHVWTGQQLAEFVVRLGLGEWIESRFA